MATASAPPARPGRAQQTARGPSPAATRLMNAAPPLYAVHGPGSAPASGSSTKTTSPSASAATGASIVPPAETAVELAVPAGGGRADRPPASTVLNAEIAVFALPLSSSAPEMPAAVLSLALESAMPTRCASAAAPLP